MVVDGYAVSFHGHDRTTSDLDIWINPIEENKEKIYQSLVSIGYASEDAKQVFGLNFREPCCFKLGDVYYPVDIFTHFSGVSYKDGSAEKIVFQVENDVKIYFISFNHLIINKMLAGRSKDKNDVDALQNIIKFKK